MITGAPEGRRLYNSRLKMERDKKARLLQARLDGYKEGYKEGFKEGKLIGSVRVLQQMLDGVSSRPEELLGLGMERLNALKMELWQRIDRR
jgi:flagellar biosynthesis/type III secretory pathway protein FliH